MFRKYDPEEPPDVSADRIAAIASRPASTGYVDASGRDHRASRTAVFKQTVTTSPFGDKLPVVIKDLSATGVRVEFFQNRPLGGRVLIDEPSIPLSTWAKVVWEGGGAGGLALREVRQGRLILAIPREAPGGVVPVQDAASTAAGFCISTFWPSKVFGASLPGRRQKRSTPGGSPCRTSPLLPGSNEPSTRL